MNDLLALYIFGSLARGDSDSASDLDILAIYDGEPNEQLRARVFAVIDREMEGTPTLAEYSADRMQVMFADGHLFAWHLFQEAKPLKLPSLVISSSYSFGRPGEYKTALADAARFTKLLASTQQEISRRPGSLVHEAGLAYLCLRNIAMSLSYLYLERVDFSRWSPLHLSQVLTVPAPCSHACYEQLIRARHASQRGAAPPIIDKLELSECLEKSASWAHAVLEEANVKS